MPDKTYHELEKRLEKSKKREGNFRSYDKVRQDARVRRQRERLSGDDSRQNAGKKTGNAASAEGQSGNNRGIGDISELTAKFARVVIPATIAVVLLGLAIYAMTNKNATEVSVNGEVIAQSKSVSFTEEEFLASLLAVIEQLEGTKVKIIDEITLAPVHGKQSMLRDDSQILNLLADVVNYQVLAAEISVDGKVIGTAKNAAEAEAIFGLVQVPYITNPENTVARFVQDVKATDTYVDKSQITPSDTIRAELSKTSTTNMEYTVVQGDVLSRIAELNGLTMSRLKDLNPGLDVAKPLQIGQKINIESTVPLVSVMTIETVTKTDEIKMEVVKQVDPNLESGQTRVVSPGKAGTKETVTQITKINGIKTAEDNISEKIIEPAQAQIETVGS